MAREWYQDYTLLINTKRGWNRNLIPNFNREWPKKKPYIFLDPMRAKEEAEGMVLDRQKRILHFQYDEVSTGN